MSQTIPNDPDFGSQWHLLNTGQDGGTSGIDIGASFVWPDYTGSGVTVGIVDEGVEEAHPDLAANADASLNYDAVAGSTVLTAAGAHGTFIAGLIAGTTDNSLYIAGIAYGATYGSIRLLGDDDDDVAVAEAVADTTTYSSSDVAAFTQLLAKDIDTSNHSYGADGGIVSHLTGDELTAALAYATEGRGGLGGIIVYAGGNERLEGSNANLNQMADQPYGIDVAALNRYGSYADSRAEISDSFSNPGANLVVSAPGVDILSTDLTGSAGDNPEGDTVVSSGTSFAAPMVTGVTALMLEANPDLGGVDVQEILAYSARRTDDMASTFNPSSATGDAGLLADTATVLANAYGLTAAQYQAVLETPWDWQVNGAGDWNGGGLQVSHDYGLGLVSALGAVRLAESWETGIFGSQRYADWRSLTADDTTAHSIADGGSLSTAISVTDSATLQRLLLNIGFTTVDPEELEISLASPDGTVSYLWQNYDLEVFNAENEDVEEPDDDETTAAKALNINSEGEVIAPDMSDITFGSTQSWGEATAGDWTLTVTDLAADGVAYELDHWGLEFYARPETANDRYVYSDAFSDVADASRQTLEDLDGGTDQLNASMVTSGSVIDLNGGAASTIDGVSLTIAEGTVIERAWGGDGDDSITGNDSANALYGGRGDDTLVAGGSDDTLDGGEGEDVLYLGGDRSGADFTIAGETVGVTASGEGTDSTTDIEAFHFADRSVLPVYRFRVVETGAHVFTRDAEEIEALEADDGYALEGIAMGAIDDADDAEDVVVWRFLNTATGGSFLTASEAEKEAVEAAGGNLVLQGAAFEAFSELETDSKAVYRLFDASESEHFYTADETERDQLLAGGYTLDGIAFYTDSFL